MDKFKKSGENVVNFIVESLKGNDKNAVYNGTLPIMPEMRNLNPSVKPNQLTNKNTKFLHILGIILGILLLIFIIYKVLESFPDIATKLKSIFGKVETEIKNIVPIENSMFDASNNLNSNQILDFLLGTKKTDPSEWCFIGESKGKRYCTLSQGNVCMSGNIFPTQNICVNPKLKT